MHNFLANNSWASLLDLKVLVVLSAKVLTKITFLISSSGLGEPIPAHI